MAQMGNALYASGLRFISDGFAKCAVWCVRMARFALQNSPFGPLVRAVWHRHARRVIIFHAHYEVAPCHEKAARHICLMGLAAGLLAAVGSSPALFYYAMAVGIQQFLQVDDLRLQFVAAVGVGHEHPVGRHFHYLRGALDVGSAFYGVGRAGERLVLHELEAAAVVYERISGNSRFVVVGLAESAVDYHQLAAGLDWVLAV